MENNISYFSKIISIFWEPAKTFKAISEKTSALDIILPIVILSLLSVATIPYITPIAIKTQVAKIEQSDKIPDEQKQQIITNMEKNQNPVMGYIFAPVGIIVGTLVMALVFLFVGNFMLGGEGKFLSVWAVTLYGSLVDIVGTAVRVPLMVQKGTLNVYTSLAIFMNESSSFLFRFAKHLDVFSIWKIVLFSIGLSVLYKKKLNSVLIILVIIWLVYCLGATVLSGFSPF
jgi:hypothetical protein